MTFRLSFLILGTSLLQSGCRNEVKKAAPVSKPKEENVESKKARFKVPLGAVISDMKHPYYDEENRLISLLIAREMTVEGGDPDSREVEDPKEVRRLNGKDLKLWLFDKDEKLSSTTTIDTAKFDIEEEQLTATGRLIMRGVDDKFVALSNGGIFTLKTGQAFLTGPTFTRFRLPESKEKPKDKTTMNLRPILPLAATVQVLAAGPPAVDPGHFEKFERLLAPRVIPLDHADDRFEKANQLNDKLTDRLTTYLTQIGKSAILTQAQAPKVAKEKDPFEEIKKLGPADLSIENDQGFYIDSAALEVAYFGVIKAQGKGMTLTCNKDLKIIFNPPEPKKDSDKKKEKKDDDNPLKDFGGFGDLKQITASGNVFMSGESKGEKFYVRGDRALFESDPKNPKTEGTVTLRGDGLSLLFGDPYDLTSKTPLIRQDSKSKDAWIIIKIKEDPDSKKVDATVQTNRGHWITSNPPRKKNE